MEPAPGTAPAALISSFAALFTAALVAYVTLLAPGQAWWHGRASATPRLFARVALSALFTTILGLALAAAGVFSLPRVALICAMAALLGYLFVGRVRHDAAEVAGRAGLGPVVFLLALWLYWPPYETFLAASDSTSYTATGVHLARAHHLWKFDPLVEELDPILQREVFFSVMGYWWMPPYTRMPGGLVIETPDSPVVHPAFFPAPVIWSALFADALGPRYAGGYAPLFAAFALWAFWYFARRRLETIAALGATALVALNAACYWAGRFPLAEPLAWFFLWAGLVALDAYEEDGFSADARLAGVLLAAVGLARVEYLVFIVAALALRYVLRADIASRPLTPGFGLWFAIISAATAAEVVLLRGAYVTPLRDALDGFHYRALMAWGEAPWMVVSAVLAGLGACVLAVRWLGFLRAVAAGVAVAIVAGYLLSAHWTAGRSLRWLAAYLGPVALVAGVVGAALAWRRRHATAGDGFFVVLALVVSALLIYSPHVYPAMPWAARRYVPVVVPALLLWAVSSVTHLRRRSFVVSLLTGAVLAVTVAWPARALWRLPFYEGTYAELRKLAETLPKDGTLLIDARMVNMLIAPPLWLAFDRNSLQVDVSTTKGRNLTSAVVFSVDDRGPVYLLKLSTAPQEDVPFVWAQRLKDFEIEVLLPEQTPAAPPKRVERYLTLVSLFELTAWRPASAPAKTPPASESRPSLPGEKQPAE